MFRLAHLTDLHVGPLERPHLRELAGKRALGYLNWVRGRAAAHRLAVLEAVLDDMRARAVDHVAVTGDLVNVSSQAEWRTGRAWLEAIGAPQDVSFVPGNHDAYVRAAGDAVASHWADYMAGDHDPHTPSEAEWSLWRRFPYVRRRGGVALIGLSSAVATAPFMASGALGAAQRARLGPLLVALAAEGLCRVVLIHHPPVPGLADRRRGLRDAPALAALLAAHGAELVLHGHNHTATLVTTDGPDRPVPILGTPSASMAPDRGKPAGQYGLIEIERGDAGWRIALERRGVDATGTVGTLARTVLTPC